jgi:hypothetical protein
VDYRLECAFDEEVRAFTSAATDNSPLTFVILPTLRHLLALESIHYFGLFFSIVFELNKLRESEAKTKNLKVIEYELSIFQTKKRVTTLHRIMSFTAQYERVCRLEALNTRTVLVRLYAIVVRSQQYVEASCFVFMCWIFAFRQCVERYILW